MKKVVLFLLMCTLFTVSFGAKKTTIVNRVFDGEYVRSTNTFTYKKNNLIFPDKVRSYQIQDDENLLVPVYNFLNLNYEVKEDQKIGLKIIGRIENGVMKVVNVQNYTIPEENLKGRSSYILFGQ